MPGDMRFAHRLAAGSASFRFVGVPGFELLDQPRDVASQTFDLSALSGKRAV